MLKWSSLVPRVDAKISAHVIKCAGPEDMNGNSLSLLLTELNITLDKVELYLFHETDQKSVVSWLVSTINKTNVLATNCLVWFTRQFSHILGRRGTVVTGRAVTRLLNKFSECVEKM